MSTELDVSVCVPVLDEAPSLNELHERLTRALSAVGSYEIIFVDDGSRDESPGILASIADRDPRVAVVTLRTTFGKAAALDAAFRRVSGRVVVTIDADLQDEPAEIPRLVAELEAGRVDLVSGWKRDRRDPLSRRIASRLFNTLVRSTTKIALHDFNCGLKAYRREVVDELQLYGDLHRYVPVLAAWRGFSVGELAVEHHARRYGRSKYGRGRAMRGLFDLVTVMTITRYRRRPLHFFGRIGVFLGLLGLGCLGYLTAQKLLGGASIGHRPLLTLGVLLLVIGVQLLSTGLLGELVIAHQSRPTYSIRSERRTRVDTPRQSAHEGERP